MSKTEAHETEAERNKPRLWIKLHTSLLEEPSLFRVSDRAGKRYFMIYILAGRLDTGKAKADGTIQEPLEDLAFHLRCSPEELTADLKELVKVGLVAQAGEFWKIVRFREEQPDMAKVREQFRERQARHRGSRKKQNQNEEQEPEPEEEPEKNESENKNKNKSESVTNALVTRDTHANTSLSSLSKPAQELQAYWQNATGTLLPRDVIASITQTLSEAGKFQVTASTAQNDILAVMEKTAGRELRGDRISYLKACLKDLRNGYEHAPKPIEYPMFTAEEETREVVPPPYRVNLS